MIPTKWHKINRTEECSFDEVMPFCRNIGCYGRSFGVSSGYCSCCYKELLTNLILDKK